MLIDRMRKQLTRHQEQDLRGVFRGATAHSVRIVLHPGPVYAIDGDRHHITASRLASLYGVPLGECIVVRTATDLHGYNFDDPEMNFVHLGPDSSGRYELPDEARKWLQTRN